MKLSPKWSKKFSRLSKPLHHYLLKLKKKRLEHPKKILRRVDLSLGGLPPRLKRFPRVGVFHRKRSRKGKLEVEVEVDREVEIVEVEIETEVGERRRNLKRNQRKETKIKSLKTKKTKNQRKSLENQEEMTP